MKVKIGPYRNWIGPYQIASILKYVGVSEDRYHDLGAMLSKTWLNDFCQWIHDKRERKVKIKIDKYDSWNADNTLALIALPLLVQLRANRHGAGFVDDADVPEHLRSTNAAPKEDENDTDEHWHARADWVLDEIIWALKQVADGEEEEQKFYTGETDILWQAEDKNKNKLGDPKPLGESDRFEETAWFSLVEGPNHTHKTDVDGLKAYHKRIDNGLLLFGKYFRSLWD